VKDRIADAVTQIRGAFSLVLLSPDMLVAVRDPFGFRPLVLGRLGDKSYIVASETCAFSLVDAQYVRDVEPGEMLVIDEQGELHSYYPFDPVRHTRKALCSFEWIYFSRPDSVLSGRSVYEARLAMGRTLAREQAVAGDVVIPVPDSGVVAALGYAGESGIPFAFGLIRNHYVGRTFIEPAQQIRRFGVRLKLSPVKHLIEGKRVIVIDDSIVRGTTSSKIIAMLRNAGASEVHMRISSPPTKAPCYMGIDTPDESQLVASTMDAQEIAEMIGADTLGYLSVEGMLKAIGHDPSVYCASCFTGIYPFPLAEEQHRKELDFFAKPRVSEIDMTSED